MKLFDEKNFPTPHLHIGVHPSTSLDNKTLIEHKRLKQFAKKLMLYYLFNIVSQFKTFNLGKRKRC
jgi:hypothetical protein